MTTSRTDELIDALIDRACTADDLVELVACMEADESARARVSAALDDERTMRAGLDEAEALAASVEPCVVCEPRIRRHRRRPVGIAVTCALLLGLVVGAFSMRVGARPMSTPQPVQQVAGEAMDEYLRLAMASGRVLEELPPVTVSVEENDSGEVEVVFVRRWLERARVGDMYRLARDEHGRVVPVKTKAAPRARRESM